MINRFILGAAPLYTLAALAVVTYWLLFQSNLLDMNAIVESAARSPYFSVFVFVCVLIESIFPYCTYFPGTILILVALTIGAGAHLSPLAYALAWLAVVLGALISYGQARFFHRLLRRVASPSAIESASATLDRYGRFARLFVFVHPNYSAAYFTALGLLAKPILIDTLYLCVGAVLSVVILFYLAGQVIGSLDLGNGGLQLVMAGLLFILGTWTGLRAARRPYAIAN